MEIINNQMIFFMGKMITLTKIKKWDLKKSFLFQIISFDRI
jgi:hypothetical protein